MSEAWSPRVTRVLAPNPSPLTLEGTNTYVVAEPDAGSAVVIDPGPADDGHALAVVSACAGRGVELVLLTHTHVDHAEGPRLRRAGGGAAGRPRSRLGHPGRPRPGHRRPGGRGRAGAPAAADARSRRRPLLLPARGRAAVFTGDHVLGRGTTVVEWPGGDMAAYLTSLELVRDLRPERLYPGHGPLVPDAVTRVEGYLAHRRDREAQVLAALAAGDRTPAEVVARSTPRSTVHPAAELSVRAHLAKLVREGRVAATDGGERFHPV